MKEEEQLLPAEEPGEIRHAMRHYIVLWTVPVVWGTFAPIVKLLDHDTPPLFLNACSHGVGTLFLAPPLVDFARHSSNEQRRRCIVCSTELGVWLFLGQTLQLVGLYETGASVNAVLVQTSVLLVSVMDATQKIRLRRPACTKSVIPAFIAFAGILLVVDDADSRANTWFGLACSCASACAYALHTWRLSVYSDVDSGAQAFGQLVVNSLLDVLSLTAVASFEDDLDWEKWLHDKSFIGVVCWNGLVVVAFATWAMSYAQKRVDPVSAAIAYAFEPVFACVFAALLLHEKLTSYQLVGALMLFASNLFGSTRQQV